jgi:hypothetical protein
MVAVVAGFIGGFVSQHLAPAPVFAQASTPASAEM